MTFPHGPGPTPRTSLGLSGLGAVGGPRGVGAGALRVIVEFLTQYDAEKVKELEAQLGKLDKLSQLSDARSSKAAKAQAADQVTINRLKQLHLALNTAELKELKTLRDFEKGRGAQAQAAAANARKAFAQSTGFRAKDIELLVNQDKIESAIAARATNRRAAEGRERDRQGRFIKSQVAAERQLTGLQQIRAQLLPKIGSLALGGLGGVVGGALVGVGFAAAQLAIDAIGQSLRDVFDPANRARDALKGVVDEVRKIADKEGITFLEAATKRLKELGEAASDIDPRILAAAASLQVFIEQNKELTDLLQVVLHHEELQRDAIAERIRLLIQQRQLENTPGIRGGPLGGQLLPILVKTGDVTHLTAQEQKLYNEVLGEFNITASQAANAARELAAANAAVAGAAQRGAYAEDQFAAAIRGAASLRITGLQDQLDALNNSGPGYNTRIITKQIDDMAEAQARSAYQSQVQALAEQRNLLLLEKRIKFQGQSVNLDKLSGKYALVAIDARISALQRAGQLDQRALTILNDRISAARQADQDQDKRDQAVLKGYDDRIAAIRKEGDAQNRFNQLLDLQFKMNQTIKRQAGESIGDFLQRRAQENRDLLAQQAELQRTDRIGVIQEERDKVAAVQETANARREAAIEALELQARVLQAALDAAQRARDAEIQALSDKRERIALEVQLEENAAQQRQLAEQEEARQRSKLLQQRLAEAQADDQKELESRRKSLQAQIQAEQDKVDAALKWAKKEEQERLRIAIAGAKSYADAQAIIGELAGATRALSELEAWVKANHIPAYLAEGILGPLRDIIKQAQNKVNSIIIPQYSGKIPGLNKAGFASGGIFPLSNAASPFGQNIRFGEQGREIGVALSNRVANILRENQPQLGEQHFTINRSDDPYRDKQRFKVAVKDAIDEALR